MKFHLDIKTASAAIAGAFAVATAFHFLSPDQAAALSGLLVALAAILVPNPKEQQP